MARADLADMEWPIIKALLSAENGRKSWNSVYARFRLWAEQGIWEAPLETLFEPGLAD